MVIFKTGDESKSVSNGGLQGSRQLPVKGQWKAENPKFLLRKRTIKN